MRPSIRSVFYAAVAAAALAAGTVVLAPSPVLAADGGKNLKVLPATMTKADLKKLMKQQATSLGVQCDFCHDTDDYAKDTEHKEVARDMMRMTEEVNARFLKAYDTRVTCDTCHRGKEKPERPDTKSTPCRHLSASI